LTQKYRELEKEQEAKLRIDMEERFSQEKKSLIENHQNLRGELFASIKERDPTNELIEEMITNLNKSNKEAFDEDLKDIDTEKDANIEKIKL